MTNTSKMMGALLGGAMMIGALALPASSLAADKSKMVIQVSTNDPATWNLALNNASNIQKDVGKDNVDLEIVAYGPGINMLKAESEVANRINDAVESGVQVSACQNTMRKAKLSKEDMNTKVGYVPSGVVEIMQRQQQGYAYLRP
jgi:intracellular sulfur oxidation DsrE/DsrF family protein